MGVHAIEKKEGKLRVCKMNELTRRYRHMKDLPAQGQLRHGGERKRTVGWDGG